MTESTPANHAVATARFSVSRVGKQSVVTAYLDGKMEVTDDGNPNFATILDRLYDNDTEGLAELFSAEAIVTKQFAKVSERVMVNGGRVFFDGDPIENTLSDHLIRLVRDGEDVSYLVNFWERIATNPSPHSREHLLRWLAAEDFSITRDGYIVGYKGLSADRTSIHSGPAIVDSVAFNGNVPNAEGSIIEIGRSKVAADSFVACSTGLHVGTWEYASSFGAITVEVLVDPRDVVSVPVDCNGQKMRVCRYKVGKQVAVNRTEPVVDVDDNEFELDHNSDWILI